MQGAPMADPAGTIEGRCESQRKERGRIWAQRFSVAFNPLLIGVPVVLAIAIREQGGIRTSDLVPAAVSILIMCVVPLVYTLILLRKGIIRNFHISDRRQRKYLFPVLFACFVAVVWILYRTGDVSPLVLALLGFGLVNCVACALISVWFKISLHCVGLAALAVGALYSFGPASAIPSAGVLALTAWSRVRLEEHTRGEVLAGCLFGGIATGFELYAALGPPPWG
jgi:hypothetical protein